jgi:ABC-type phosphate transport system substrate-binding protein
MSRHHKRRRFASLAACVGSTAALAALGSAGPAMASVKCLTPGFSSGSSLQNSAQNEIWLKHWSEHTSCETPSTITYTKTASGNGLNEFGNNTGVLNAAEDPGAVKAEGEGKGIKDAESKVLDFYVGTDDPPSVRQLSEAEHAAGAKNGPVEITVPVAQAPVTVILSLPAGCRIAAGSTVDLNNTSIGQLWEGLNAKKGSDPGGIQAQGGYAADTWGAFFKQLGYTEVGSEGALKEDDFFNKGSVEEELLREVEVEPGKFETQKVKVKGEGCTQQIIPQARSAESGTSYAFKTYLSQINPSVWNEFASDFQNWPSSLVLLEDKNTSGKGSKESEGGGNLAENTAANPGSVGYAAVADAAKNGPFTNNATINQFGTGKVKEGATEVAAKSLQHQVLWAQIQDNGIEPEPESSGYVDPLLGGESHAANCQTSKLTPYDGAFPYSYKDSWAGITTTDPNIKGDTEDAVYPICAMTYDLVWHHLGNAHLYGKEGTLAQEVANTTKDLMEYIIGHGQEEIQGNYYSRFPSAMQAHVHEGVVHIEK